MRLLGRIAALIRAWIAEQNAEADRARRAEETSWHGRDARSLTARTGCPCRHTTSLEGEARRQKGLKRQSK